MTALHAPTKYINQLGFEGKAQKDGYNSRNPSWVVAFVRYATPVAFQTKNPEETLPIIVVRNDCTAVTINNPKGSFGKMASLNLKPTDIWYPSIISPGDWCFVWLQNNQTDADRIAELVKTLRSNPSSSSVGKKLCDYKSGLKFVGRVTSTANTDTVDSSGRRTLIHSIQAQAFLEFATSVYYTYGARSSINSTNSDDKQYLIDTFHMKGLTGKLKDFAEKFIEVYRQNKRMSPDVIVAIMYAFIFGIDRGTDHTRSAVGLGSPNDAIIIPKEVATILNKGKATKLWEVNKLLLGIQKYNNTGAKDYWKDFFPSSLSRDTEDFMYTSSYNLKGFVPFAPVLWDNRNAWSILKEYLNEVCNELYTCLRMDEEGRIGPTVVMREKPFSTGLIWKMNGAAGLAVNTSNSKTNFIRSSEPERCDLNNDPNLEPEYQETSAVSALLLADQNKNSDVENWLNGSGGRTMFGELPRWKIAESLVRSFSISCKEANRVNFVQVYGSSAAIQFFLGRKEQSQEAQKGILQEQFIMGNYQYDPQDITRHGLRAAIITSMYDIWLPDGTGSMAPLWAAMNADWLFNGHLKPSGTLITNGLVDPIAEGDNLEFRGIVFHIDAISHAASVAPSGHKNFVTTISLSNGILAASLDDDKKDPVYPVQRDGYRTTQESPGYTYLQNKKKGE